MRGWVTGCMVRSVDRWLDSSPTGCLLVYYWLAAELGRQMDELLGGWRGECWVAGVQWVTGH